MITESIIALENDDSGLLGYNRPDVVLSTIRWLNCNMPIEKHRHVICYNAPQVAH